MMQNNVLPQSSVLTPFLIFTQIISRGDLQRIIFLYTDNLLVATQGSNFIEKEERIKESLETLTEYYNVNHL